MLNQLKGIKGNLDSVSFKIIKDSLKDILHQVRDLEYETKLKPGMKLEPGADYIIYKICLLMQNTDIYELSFIELEEYINKLIVLVEFMQSYISLEEIKNGR